MSSVPALKAELDHVALNCGATSPLTAAKWYSDVLGFAPINFDEFASGSRPFPSVRVSPGCILDFFNGEGEGAAPQALNHICFALGSKVEVEAVVGRLGKAGYSPEDKVPKLRSGARGEGFSVYARDLMGHTLEFRYYEG